MKLLDYTITLTNPKDPITLFPFGCVHADDPGFRHALFRQFINEVNDTPNALAIGLGDYSNFLRTTARKHIKSYTADDNSFNELDDMVKNRADGFYADFLGKLKKGKLVGLAEGNHYWEFQNKTTDTQYLCDLANVPYLDKPCFLRLNIQYANRTLRVLRILIHHGDWSGGWSRMGGDVNGAEMKALGFDFDVYIFSHTHRLWAVQIPTLTIPSSGELKPVERPRLFIRTGCFVAGFDEKACTGNGYAAKKLLNPTALGYVKAQIQFYQEYDKERYEKIKDRPGRRKGGTTGNWKYKFVCTY